MAAALWHAFFIVQTNPFMNTTKPGKNISQQAAKRKSTNPLTTKQIIRRHIVIEDDVITENDIKYVKIETCIPAKIEKNLPTTPVEELAKDEAQDHPVVNPWDVIK